MLLSQSNMFLSFDFDFGTKERKKMRNRNKYTTLNRFIFIKVFDISHFITIEEKER